MSSSLLLRRATPTPRVAATTAAKPRLVESVTRVIAIAAVICALAEGVADVLPDGAVFGVVTPLRAALSLGLAATLFAAVRAPKPRDPASAALVRLPPSAWACVWWLGVALVLLTTAVASFGFGTWSAWRSEATGVAAGVLVMAACARWPGTWRALAVGATMGVTVLAATGLQQVTTGVATGFCRGALDGSADSCGAAGVVARATGTFSNPNLLAAALLLLLPATVAWAAAMWPVADRSLGVLTWLVVAGGLATLALTLSRGGLIAAVAAIAAWWLLNRPTMTRLLVGAVGAGLGVAAVLVAFGSGRIGVREQVWKASAGLLERHPLGVGPGRSGDLIDLAVPGDERFAHAHNLVLDQAVSSGIAGGVALMLVLAAAIAAVLRGAGRGHVSAVVVGVSLAGFLAASVLDDPANTSRVWLLMWMMLGAAVASATRDLPEGAATVLPKPEQV